MYLIITSPENNISALIHDDFSTAPEFTLSDSRRVEMIDPRNVGPWTSPELALSKSPAEAPSPRECAIELARMDVLANSNLDETMAERIAFHEKRLRADPVLATVNPLAERDAVIIAAHAAGEMLSPGVLSRRVRKRVAFKLLLSRTRRAADAVVKCFRSSRPASRRLNRRGRRSSPKSSDSNDGEPPHPTASAPTTWQFRPIAACNGRI